MKKILLIVLMALFLSPLLAQEAKVYDYVVIIASETRRTLRITSPGGTFQEEEWRSERGDYTKVMEKINEWESRGYSWLSETSIDDAKGGTGLFTIAYFLRKPKG